MRIVQVFNRYRSGFGGEFHVVEQDCRFLRARGHEVLTLERDGGAITGLVGKAAALLAGAYSWKARAEMDRLLRKTPPDIVHVHNLYPLLSPSVHDACATHRIPVITSVHNLGLVCPVGTQMRGRAECRKCERGAEHWCLIHKCGGSIAVSAACALRSAVARRARLFTRNVGRFVVPSWFVRERVVAAGIPDGAVVEVPHCVDPPPPATPENGRYAAFAGRLHLLKGVGTLLAAAAHFPHLPVLIAGDDPLRDVLEKKATPNVSFYGYLQGQELDAFYRGACFAVVHSRGLESFGLAAAEAMSCGVPVVASRSGALPEVLGTELESLLFTPGNADELSTRMALLWERRKLVRELGLRARERVLQEFGEELYVTRLTGIYRDALLRGQKDRDDSRQGDRGVQTMFHHNGPTGQKRAGLKRLGMAPSSLAVIEFAVETPHP